jgi:hypothetical protein
MNKALAVVRTAVLVFLVGYTVRAMPWYFGLPAGSAQAYDTCRISLSLMTRAAWIAIAWVAVETAIGWLVATRRPKAGPEAPAAPPGRA